MDSEALDLALQTMRQFAARELTKDVVLALDREDRFPEPLMRKMLGPELGLHLLPLPEDCGGLGGGAFEACRLSEELSYIDLGMGTAFLAILLGTDPLRVGGTKAQRERWIGRIAEEGLIVAYAVTEPGGGSDVSQIKTRAVPVEEDGGIVGYRITGQKAFITNGGVADVYTILAIAPGGASFFVVEKGAPGLEPGRPEEKHGIRASNTTMVALDEVFVPADHLVGGEEGRGFAQANEVFAYTRLVVGAMALGAGRAALDRAIAYAAERTVEGGVPLNQKQGFTHKLLVPHYVRLQAASATILAFARLFDQGNEDLGTEGAIAKLFATESANAAADAAIQALGGYGYVHECEVEKIRRDVRITKIYEGTSEILQKVVAWDRWRKTLLTRGGFYRAMAEEMAQLHTRSPAVGANTVAAAASNLASGLDLIAKARLTRQQYLTFRLANAMTWVEVAACTAKATVERGGGAASDDRSLPWDAISRSMAREAAAVTAQELAMILVGSDAATHQDLITRRNGEPDLLALWGAQRGDVNDFDRIATYLRQS